MCPPLQPASVLTLRWLMSLLALRKSSPHPVQMEVYLPLQPAAVLVFRWLLSLPGRSGSSPRTRSRWWCMSTPAGIIGTGFSVVVKFVGAQEVLPAPGAGGESTPLQAFSVLVLRWVPSLLTLRKSSPHPEQMVVYLPLQACFFAGGSYLPALGKFPAPGGVASATPAGRCGAALRRWMKFTGRSGSPSGTRNMSSFWIFWAVGQYQETCLFQSSQVPV